MTAAALLTNHIAVRERCDCLRTYPGGICVTMTTVLNSSFFAFDLSSCFHQYSINFANTELLTFEK